ncbi:unnamed protein product, partial [Brassica rapa]
PPLNPKVKEEPPTDRERESGDINFLYLFLFYTLVLYIENSLSIEDVHLVCVTSLSLLHKKSFCVKRLRETMKSLKRERVLFLLFLGLGFGFVGFFLSHPFYVPVKKRRSRDESCLL